MPGTAVGFEVSAESAVTVGQLHIYPSTPVCDIMHVCSRAGLGGGMGVFLAGPIVDELGQCAKAGDEVLPSARRVLEVVVPLVYRAAMKAAFLDLGTAGVTAKVSLVPARSYTLFRGQFRCCICTAIVYVQQRAPSFDCPPYPFCAYTAAIRTLGTSAARFAL